jgi:hypothetical protein
MNTSSVSIQVRTAYILTGQSSIYGSPILTALALTTIEEGDSSFSDEELQVIGEKRVAEKIAELLVKQPETDIIKSAVKVGMVSRKNNNYKATN